MINFSVNNANLYTNIDQYWTKIRNTFWAPKIYFNYLQIVINGLSISYNMFSIWSDANARVKRTNNNKWLCYVLDSICKEKNGSHIPYCDTSYVYIVYSARAKWSTAHVNSINTFRLKSPVSIMDQIYEVLYLLVSSLVHFRLVQFILNCSNCSVLSLFSLASHWWFRSYRLALNVFQCISVQRTANAGSAKHFRKRILFAKQFSTDSACQTIWICIFFRMGFPMRIL